MAPIVDNWNYTHESKFLELWTLQTGNSIFYDDYVYVHGGPYKIHQADVRSLNLNFKLAISIPVDLYAFDLSENKSNYCIYDALAYAVEKFRKGERKALPYAAQV